MFNVNAKSALELHNKIDDLGSDLFDPDGFFLTGDQNLPLLTRILDW